MTNPVNELKNYRKSIDWKVFEKLCQERCTDIEISSFFDICRQTLYTRVEEQYGEPYLTIVRRFQLLNNCYIRNLRYTHAKKNYKAFEELAARYLGEFPLIGTEKQQIDPQVEGKYNSLMSSLEKFQSSDLKISDLKIADNNNNPAQ